MNEWMNMNEQMNEWMSFVQKLHDNIYFKNMVIW